MSSFLKNLGVLVSSGSGLIGGIGSMFGGRIGGLAEIARLAVTIEAVMHGKQGSEKLSALSALAGQVVRSSELVSGKEIADENLLQKGITGLSQAVVDILNSLKHGK